jgi:type IV secretion system protein VirB6
MGVGTLVTSDAMIAGLMEEVDTLLKLYMKTCYDGLAHYLFIPATLVASIYVAIQGIRMMFGELDLDLSIAMKTFFRIGAIFMLLGSGGWGYVSKYLYDFLSVASQKIGNLLIKSESPIDVGNVGSVFDGLQGVLNQFSGIGEDFFSAGHWMSPLPYIDGLVVWGVGFALTGFALFQIIVAKVLFSILIIFLPVVVIFCFFEIFQGLLDRWLGFVIAIFFLQILINIVLAFDLALSDWWLGSFQISSVTHLSNLTAIPVLILGIISIGLMGKVSTLSYAIGSGVSSLSGASGGGRLVGRALWGRHRVSVSRDEGRVYSAFDAGADSGENSRARARAEKNFNHGVKASSGEGTGDFPTSKNLMHHTKNSRRPGLDER